VVFCDPQGQFGAHLPVTKFMVIKNAASQKGTIAPHKTKMYPSFILPLKMYKQIVSVSKLIHFENIYTPNENKRI
jgi:hypothetical protein